MTTPFPPRLLRSARRVLGFLLAWAMVVLPVHAQVPSAFPFQGLLLDAAGQPTTDTVDLDFALFPGLTGGTAVWSESHLGVSVVDGVYSVALGETTPIDVSILEAGPVFLEIRVEGETLVPRQQLLSVPYARVAERAQNVGGVQTLFLEQMIEQYDFDGGLPANTDPSEGTGDADGDGVANFLDADNDADGLGDAQEVAAGSSINLRTPRLERVTPNSVVTYVPVTLLVEGTHLETIQSARFGPQSATPTDVTPTSFRITVTPDTLSASLPVVIATLANGQEGQSPPVGLSNVAPTIATINPPFLVQLQAAQIVLTGTNFVPGTVVQAASFTIVPDALTPTSLTVTIPPRPVGPLDVRVLHPNGLFATKTIQITTTAQAKRVFLTQGSFSGNLGGLAGADAACQAEATAASLPGTYRAWLSDASASAASRFPQNVGPYAMPNGVLVAGSWGDLTDGSLLTPLNVTAAGAVVSGFTRAWTGTQSNGSAYTATADHCNGWTSTAGTGRTGFVHQAGAWTDVFPSQPCNTTGVRLYCFEE